MAEDTVVGEDMEAGEEDTGAAAVGVEEDITVGVVGDTGVDVSIVFHPRDILLLSSFWPFRMNFL